MCEADVKDQIIRELVQACRHLGAKSDLMGTACSYGDTLSDEDVLGQLRDWNSHGVVHPQHPHAENMLRRLLEVLDPAGKAFSKARECDLEAAWQKAMKLERAPLRKEASGVHP